MRDAFFITRHLTVAIQDVPDSAPPTLNMCRKLSCPILLLESNPPKDWAHQRLQFKRITPCNEEPVLYEEEKYR